MKFFSICFWILLFQLEVHGQLLKGTVSSANSNKPLEYVSVGIINTSFGTITDVKGHFELEVKGLDLLSIVRISMVGYKQQKFTIEELLLNTKEIKLIEDTIRLAEIIIKPTTTRKVGVTGFDKSSGWSGWGGVNVGKGCEMGTKINLGNQPVKLKSFHVMLHRQAFDTSYYRLHIRSIEDTLITNELLTENIIISITNESGWTQFDLEPYNLILSGEVGLTLEWLKVKDINKDRAMKINGKLKEAYVLFKNKKDHIGLYRWGPEAKWIINKNMSPSMYLTIME